MGSTSNINYYLLQESCKMGSSLIVLDIYLLLIRATQMKTNSIQDILYIVYCGFFIKKVQTCDSYLERAVLCATTAE